MKAKYQKKMDQATEALLKAMSCYLEMAEGPEQEKSGLALQIEMETIIASDGAIGMTGHHDPDCDFGPIEIWPTEMTELLHVTTPDICVYAVFRKAPKLSSAKNTKEQMNEVYNLMAKASRAVRKDIL